MGEEDAMSEKIEPVANGKVEGKTEAVKDKKGEEADVLTKMEEDKQDEGKSDPQQMDVDKEKANGKKAQGANGASVEGTDNTKKEEEAEADKENQEIAKDDGGKEEPMDEKMEEEAEPEEDKTKGTGDKVIEDNKSKDEEDKPEEPKGSRKRPRSKIGNGKRAKNKEPAEVEKEQIETPTEKKAKEPKRSVQKKEIEPRTPTAFAMERPVRERKSVERLVATVEKDSSKAFRVEKGSGTALKDIPNVAYKLSKKKNEETFKLLHSILFGRRAKEKQLNRLKEKLDKCVKEKLIEFCDVLDVPISKAHAKKEDIVAVLMEFFVKPHASTSDLLAEKEQGLKRKRPSKSASGSSTPSKGSAKSRKKGESDSKKLGEAKSSPPESEDESEEDKGEDRNGAQEGPEEMSDQAVSEGKGSEPEEESDEDIVDLSSLGFTRTSPTESASELPFTEESINLMEVPQMDSISHMEGLLEIPAKLASRRAKTGEIKNNSSSGPHPEQQKASTSSLENGAGRSLRPRKRDSNICELVDEEDGDETFASGESSKERPFSSTIDEDYINNEQPQLESESQQKKLKRKSKKTENGKEKPPKKSKKAKEASEQETVAKPKKFKHSTRRRQVDKNLLDIQDEFNPREVSLRDLILLADHRVKQMKTGAVAAEAPATHQSTGNSDYNNDPAGQYSNDPAGQYDDDGEEGPIAEDTTEYFNYQSRMEKTPRGRWSKQDDELFYEAVQQFGTDFSMIAQLFPGRSREQIRNKYKKEERRHPLRVRDALTNRFRDHSHFQKVIENLNKIRGEEEEEEEENFEDFMSTEGQDEEARNIDNDDEGKDKHIDEKENGDRTNGYNEVQSPVDAKVEEEKERKKEEEEEKEEEFDEEDEMFLFSQYKSDM